MNKKKKRTKNKKRTINEVSRRIWPKSSPSCLALKASISSWDSLGSKRIHCSTVSFKGYLLLGRGTTNLPLFYQNKTLVKKN